MTVPTNSGNNTHYTAGSSKGGQFAPKNGAAASGQTYEHYKPLFSFEKYKKEMIQKLKEEEGLSDSDLRGVMQDIESALKEEYDEMESEWKADYAAIHGDKDSNEYYQYKDLQDFIDNSIEKLWTPDVITDVYKAFKDKDPSNGSCYVNENGSKYPDSERWSVNVFAAVLQQKRYPSVKMNPISEKEFIQRVGYLDNTAINGGHWSTQAHRECYDRVFNSPPGTEIPLYRNISLDSSTDMKISHENMFTQPKTIEDTMLGHGSWGSVVYMSVNREYSENWGGNMLIGGIVTPSELRILKCHDRNDATSQEFQNISNGLYNLYSSNANYKNQLSAKIQQVTGAPKQDCDDLTLQFLSSIRTDAGLYAIVMGYDAVFGDAGQLDIVNTSKVDLIYN